MAVSVTFTIIWDVILCSLVEALSLVLMMEATCFAGMLVNCCSTQHHVPNDNNHQN